MVGKDERTECIERRRAGGRRNGLVLHRLRIYQMA
jgi:hypothetical protein